MEWNKKIIKLQFEFRWIGLNRNQQSYSVKGIEETANKIITLDEFNLLPVTTIADFAFYQRYLLKSITYIHENAFKNYTSLKDIYFTGTEEEWNNIYNSNHGLSSNITIHYNYEA